MKRQYFLLIEKYIAEYNNKKDMFYVTTNHKKYSVDNYIHAITIFDENSNPIKFVTPFKTDEMWIPQYILNKLVDDEVEIEIDNERAVIIYDLGDR